MTPGTGVGGEQEVRIRDTDGQGQGNTHTHTHTHTHSLSRSLSLSLSLSLSTLLITRLAGESRRVKIALLPRAGRTMAILGSTPLKGWMGCGRPLGVGGVSSFFHVYWSGNECAK